jgi:hypothetical protein
MNEERGRHEQRSTKKKAGKKGKLIINSHDLNEYLISLVPPFFTV